MISGIFPKDTFLATSDYAILKITFVQVRFTLDTQLLDFFELPSDGVFPMYLVCLPCAINFPVALLVRSTEANDSDLPSFKTCAVISMSSPILAGDMYLERKYLNSF